MISAYILEFDLLTPTQRAQVDHWIGGEPPPRSGSAPTPPDPDITTEQREGWAYQEEDRP